jgi:hypothetical protein
VLGTEDIMARSPDFRVRRLFLLLHDRSGNLQDTVLTLPNGRWGQTVTDGGAPWLFPWFESFAEVTALGDRLLVGHGSEPELQVLRLSAGTETEAIIRWTGQDRTVEHGDVRAAQKVIEDRYTDADPGMRRRLLEPLVHEDRPVADQMPAFTAVMAGVDRSIWIREYPRPGGNPQARWIRFDESGRFLCRLSIPAGLEVFEFGDDYVLGEEEGEFGEEIVAVYDIRWH